MNKSWSEEFTNFNLKHNPGHNAMARPTPVFIKIETKCLYCKKTIKANTFAIDCGGVVTCQGCQDPRCRPLARHSGVTV